MGSTGFLLENGRNPTNSLRQGLISGQITIKSYIRFIISREKSIRRESTIPAKRK